MQKLIILAAIAACCMGAPSTHNQDYEKTPAFVSLQRPSPINPAVASDPKPVEKITVITDPKEVAKFKRESGNHPHELQHLTPTVAPAHHTEAHKPEHQNKHEDHHSTPVHDEHHHRQKRDEQKKPVQTSSKPVAPAAPKPAAVSAAPKKPVAPPAPVKTQPTPTKPKPKRTRKASSSTPVPPTKKTAVPVAPTKKSASVPAPAVPQKHRQKRDETNVQPSSTVVHHAVAEPLKLTNEEVHPAVAQTLPAHLPETKQPIAPVRHQHIGALFHAAEAHVDLHGGHPATSTPVVGVVPATTAHTAEKRYPDFSAGHPATSHSFPSSTTPKSHVDAKRDIPVPLIAKHQHPEESPKDEKKDEKKEEHLNKDEDKKDAQHSDVVPKKDDIQVEDLSDKAPGLQKPQHHPLLHHQQHEFHPQHPVQNSHEETQASVAGTTASSTTTTTTTEHPVIRHHPVPVAELFARPKQ